jgi:hypothetical protein
MTARTSTEAASALLDRKITVAFGRSKKADRWLNETLPLLLRAGQLLPG